MTRTVFDNYQTAHVWAAQTQYEGRSNNGNLWFEGRAIFSYGRHYCAGYALPDCDGGIVYLTNADSSSITTNGKHMPAVCRAIPRDDSTPYGGFSVPGLTEFFQTLNYLAHTGDTKAARRARAFPSIRKALAKHWPGHDGAAAILAAMGSRDPAKEAATIGKRHAAAVAKEKARLEKAAADRQARKAKEFASVTPADMRGRIAKALGSYPNAEYAAERLADQGRDVNRAAKEAKARGWTQIAATCRDHYRAIRAAVKEAEKRHAAAYRNRNRRNAIQEYRDSVVNLDAALKAAPASQSEPATVAANIARHAAAVARDAAALSRHVPLSESTLARLASIQDAARIMDSEYDAKAAALKAAAIKEAIQEWRDGGNPAAARYFDSPHGGAAVRAVRVERDESGAITGGTLETSHRASVPLVAALRVFRFLKHCRDTGESFRANGRRLPVGSFRVDSVTPQGDFVAGCHRIKWKEVAALAESLGVASLAGADTTDSPVAA